MMHLNILRNSSSLSFCPLISCTLYNKMDSNLCPVPSNLAQAVMLLICMRQSPVSDCRLPVTVLYEFLHGHCWHPVAFMCSGHAVGLLVFCYVSDRWTKVTKLMSQKEVPWIDPPPYLPGSLSQVLRLNKGAREEYSRSLEQGHCHHPKGFFLWLQYTCVMLHTFEQKTVHSVDHHPSNVLECFS
jgi:hypothetical protein